MKRFLIILAGALILAGCNKPGDSPNPPVPEDVTSKTPGLTMFYKGSTMCFASFMQDMGLVYRENGTPKDPYASLKDHGANCVRLQLDQVAFDKFGGVNIDWQSWKRVVADSKKAQAQGLQIFLTMKPDYDVFTDASTHHNIVAPAWSGKSEQQLGELLHDWVLSQLEALAKEGIYPAIVAVGNEVNVGFMKARSSDGADNARTGRLLASGHKAVREYASAHNPSCLSAVHVADPGKTLWAIQQMESAGAADYDLIAVSYYPGKDIGHSMPYADFSAMCKALPKPMMIVETAYSFTTGTVGGKWMGDWCSNAYNYPDWNDATNAANYTPAKQREWLAKLAGDVKAGGGLGVITWGTESLPDTQSGKAEGHGTGLYTYPASWAYGSTWENNSYWDFTNGNNLHEGIDWMKDVQ